MDGSTPLVTLRDAQVRFGATAPVWSGLDLDLHRGEFLTLLGPSGCGKSTVLRVMAGLQGLSQGAMTSLATSPAFVFQEPALLPWATLAENVELPLQVAGELNEVRRQHVADVLARVGLSGREALLPHELSGGMKMRASIARALVMRPDLMLMDEPFAALDDPTRQRLQADLLQWWQAQGFALCFVTHQVAEAVFMSTRVVVMDRRGRLMQSMSTPEPYPRTEDYRRSVRFHERCVAVAEALTQAAGNESVEAFKVVEGTATEERS